MKAGNTVITLLIKKCVTAQAPKLYKETGDQSGRFPSFYREHSLSEQPAHSLKPG